MDLGFVMGR
jgi:hypothetical protein